jgi:hypothetical protein
LLTVLPCLLIARRIARNVLSFLPVPVLLLTVLAKEVAKELELRGHCREEEEEEAQERRHGSA